MQKALIKAAACLTLAILGSAPALQAQTWSPLLSNGSFWSFNLAFLDSQRLYVVGLPGTLLRSADGGATWTESVMPKAKYGWNIQATHPDTAWLWSNDTLYRSVDGTANWTYRKTPDVPAFRCQFLNGTQGFLAPFSGGLYATLDGGATWTLRRQANRKGLVELNFLDPVHGFAMEADSSGAFPWKYTALKTTDSGKTWTALNLPPDVQASLSDYQGVHFTSPLQGAVTIQTTTGQNLELSTQDGGASWSRREIPKHDSISVRGSIGESFLYGFNYHLSSSRWAVVSRDGGKTWSSVTGTFPADVKDVRWRHPDTGWAIGPGFVFKTADGGKTWTQQIATLSAEDLLDDILFQDPLNGWAAENRRIYRTANGGRTWTLQATSDTTYWTSLHLSDFMGSRTLMALGIRRPAGSTVDIHVIGMSKDQGSTWKETSLDNLVKANGIAFGSAQTGYALVNHTARDSLGLLKTTDRGDTWKLVRLPYRARGAVIQFLDENDGFLAATGLDVDSLLIVRVGQGGAASSVAARFPKTGFAGMHWEDIRRGWVLSRDTVYRTLDGGTSWSKTGLGSWKGSYRVVALDARNAAVYADSGMILKTTDGFATWTVEKLPIQIRDLQFLPSGDGYAMGGQGQLMRYSAVTVSLRRGTRPPRSLTGNAGPRFESGGVRFHAAQTGRAGIKAVDASGRHIGVP